MYYIHICFSCLSCVNSIPREHTPLLTWHIAQECHSTQKESHPSGIRNQYAVLLYCSSAKRYYIHICLSCVNSIPREHTPLLTWHIAQEYHSNQKESHPSGIRNQYAVLLYCSSAERRRSTTIPANQIVDTIFLYNSKAERIVLI